MKAFHGCWLQVRLAMLPPNAPAAKAYATQPLPALRSDPVRVGVDLGSGDGRIAMALARAGVQHVHGFELNLLLVL
jgi:predicted RNA methylase